MKVVSKIFNHLGSKDLLKCRSVGHHLWRERSTEILIARRALEINFNYLDDEKKFKNIDSPDLTLMDLNKILTTSIELDWKFPCVKFGFNNTHYGKRDFQKFISLHGSKVKELKLDLVAHEDTAIVADRFGKLLSSKVPNLELLHITKVSDDWDGSVTLFPEVEVDDNTSSSSSKKFPQLKSLVCGSEINPTTFKIGQDILRSANLQYYGYSSVFEQLEKYKMIFKDIESSLKRTNFAKNEFDIVKIKIENMRKLDSERLEKELSRPKVFTRTMKKAHDDVKKLLLQHKTSSEKLTTKFKELVKENVECSEALKKSIEKCLKNLQDLNGAFPLNTQHMDASGEIIESMEAAVQMIKDRCHFLLAFLQDKPRLFN